MYLARVALGLTFSDAGLLFGRDRTTVSHACRRVENLRDDAGFDALLDTMETFVLRPDTRGASR
jgi:chromosomal replication initiation ATPase DnaA